MTLKKLGRYELLRVLGKGAMGVVYEGRDPNLDRRVAIKTVRVENLSEEAAAEYEHRFRTEARSAARLQHPNIVSVYDSDRDTNVAFLVMEYIQGDDLKHHLDRGVRYSLEQSLKIIRDLLSALDYAHKQGIVHRDIKPANLLMEPGGRIKLTDFGVARIQDSGEATRTQGSVVGTLKYMAPEQVQGQKIDSRADLFSVGVVLYQLLTDKRPFDGDNDFSIIHQIIGHEPAAPSSINPRLPGALDAVVARALAKSRDQRFATARDFAVALQAAIRRAEDQTVVPPLNPLKKVEVYGSRPLTVPGTVPGGVTNAPTSGSVTSVTQELELVYWKDVKDSHDTEDLHGFLDKFPSGIYADLARRRLRRLTAPAEATNIGGGTVTSLGTAPGIDLDATRMRDPTRPHAGTVPGGAFPGGTVPGNLPGSASPRPADWVDQEYTRAPAPGASFVAAAGAAAQEAPPPAAPEPTVVEPPAF
ncbi:MAG: protein kinase (serine/threonine-protein kinase)-like protein, partial [Ramlibacter sp.]|uniref:serine/threonine-protein kinase n=1 Tax=Ramlibacter sp. TaxID=1917967 RepID=UPI00263A3236